MQSYKWILSEALKQQEDVQFEYVMIFIKLTQQVQPTVKSQMIDELAKHEELLIRNDRIREVLGKLEL